MTLPVDLLDFALHLWPWTSSRWWKQPDKDGTMKALLIFAGNILFLCLSPQSPSWIFQTRAVALISAAEVAAHNSIPRNWLTVWCPCPEGNGGGPSRLFSIGIYFTSSPAKLVIKCCYLLSLCGSDALFWNVPALWYLKIVHGNEPGKKDVCYKIKIVKDAGRKTNNQKLIKRNKIVVKYSNRL